MDKINEYPIEGKVGEYTIEVPEGSVILSARKGFNSDIILGVWVDLDNHENMVEKTVIVFDTESEIEDTLKANFIGVITTNQYRSGMDVHEDVLYVFEKLR